MFELRHIDWLNFRWTFFVMQGVYSALVAVGHLRMPHQKLGRIWLTDTKRLHWDRGSGFRFFMELMLFMEITMFMVQLFSRKMWASGQPGWIYDLCYQLIIFNFLLGPKPKLDKMWSRDADLAQKIGVVTALEVRACGINYTFAPCVAVSWKSYLSLLCLCFKLI